jgi:hypothetical protein
MSDKEVIEDIVRLLEKNTNLLEKIAGILRVHEERLKKLEKR